MLERVILYRCLDMRKLPRGWPLLLWDVAGFLTVLSGISSGNTVAMIVGIVMVFMFTSVYLTSYVKSEHRAKRALEVVSALVAIGAIMYGYAITGSLVLGVITLFILIIFFFAFVVSYLLPRIRSRSES